MIDQDLVAGSVFGTSFVSLKGDFCHAQDSTTLAAVFTGGKTRILKGSNLLNPLGAWCRGKGDLMFSSKTVSKAWNKTMSSGNRKLEKDPLHRKGQCQAEIGNWKRTPFTETANGAPSFDTQ